MFRHEVLFNGSGFFKTRTNGQQNKGTRYILLTRPGPLWSSPGPLLRIAALSFIRVRVLLYFFFSGKISFKLKFSYQRFQDAPWALAELSKEGMFAFGWEINNNSGPYWSSPSLVFEKSELRFIFLKYSSKKIHISL